MRVDPFHRLGRRVRKQGSGGASGDVRFLYEGWNLIAEVDSSGNLTRRFAWGLDASGSLQGAGGVGGLLAIQDGSSTYYPVYDASNNVLALYSNTGGFAAAYEYDPFGRVQTSTGSYAGTNSFRFSTKYTDAETDFAYYGMRFYSPLLGRFINRDPMDEEGGINLYAFCANDGVNRYDYLGMVEQAVRGPTGIEEGRKIDQGTPSAATYHVFGPNGAAYYSDEAGEWKSWDNKRQMENSNLVTQTLLEMGSMLAEGVATDLQLLDRHFMQPMEQFTNWVGEGARMLGDKALPGFGEGTRNLAAAGMLFYSPSKFRVSFRFAIVESRFIPNPGGKLGDAITRETVSKVVKDLNARGFTDVSQEVLFQKGPMGLKNRFADIVAIHPQTGESFIINIGKQTKSGMPIMRERMALDDIIFSPTIQNYPNSRLLFIEKGASGLPSGL